MLMNDVSNPTPILRRKSAVSGGTVHVRMKKTMDMGIRVQGANLVVNCRLGYDICAFSVFILTKALYDDVSEELKNTLSGGGLLQTGLSSIFAKSIAVTPITFGTYFR
ncbi:MAG: hypothetical protein IPM82_15260 [Saprospiraceae bacterium]|nr:hypothetical protein [Saprospiraceae bacterium]